MSKALSAAAVSLGAALCFGTLVSGADLLGVPLPGGLPAGNVLAWLGLLGCSTAAVLLASSSTAIRMLAWLALAISVAWLPVSIALAGNLALNFSGALGGYWLSASALVLVLVIAVFLLATGSAIIDRLKRAGSA